MAQIVKKMGVEKARVNVDLQMSQSEWAGIRKVVEANEGVARLLREIKFGRND